MSKIRELIDGIIGETIALVIGWIICVAMLGAGYGVGVWAAPHLSWQGNREMLGLLSALTLIWLYERRTALERYERLCELLNLAISK